MTQRLDSASRITGMCNVLELLGDDRRASK